MNSAELQFWQLLYKLNDLAGELKPPAGSKKDAKEIAQYFRLRLLEGRFVKSDPDRIWWIKTIAVFKSALKRGLTKQDIIEILDLAFLDESYHKWIIHPNGILRNYEPKWLKQKELKQTTLSRKNFDDFLGG